jgi:hypothetical protein
MPDAANIAPPSTKRKPTLREALEWLAGAIDLAPQYMAPHYQIVVREEVSPAGVLSSIAVGAAGAEVWHQAHWDDPAQTARAFAAELASGVWA